MVLIRRWAAIAGVVLGLTPLAWAQKSESLKIQNPSCPLRVRPSSGQKGGWKPFNRSLQKGAEVLARPSARDPDVVVFEIESMPKLEFVGRRSCLFAQSRPSATSSGSVTGVVRDLNTKRSWILFLDATSWQEKLSIKESQSNRTAELRSTQVGFCPGLQWMSQATRWERGWGLCGLYAKAQIANASQPQDGELDYDAKNADVFGLKVYPSIYFRPRSEQVAIGFLIPVLFRFAPWPVPASAQGGVSVGPRWSVLAGLELEGRFERGIFVFSQKVGFYNRPRSLNWSIQAGFKFD